MKEFLIGVKDLLVTLKCRCPKNGQMGELLISFSIKANLLPAALSDDLLKTIDYHCLSITLKEALIKLDCMDEASIRSRAFLTFKNFSPLISDAYLKITASCHGSLIVEESLLKAIG